MPICHRADALRRYLQQQFCGLRRGCNGLPGFLEQHLIWTVSEAKPMVKENPKNNNLSNEFQVFAAKASGVVGSKWAFAAAIALIVGWAITGSYFHLLRYPAVGREHRDYSGYIFNRLSYPGHTESGCQDNPSQAR